MNKQVNTGESKADHRNQEESKPNEARLESGKKNKSNIQKPDQPSPFEPVSMRMRRLFPSAQAEAVAVQALAAARQFILKENRTLLRTTDEGWLQTELVRIADCYLWGKQRFKQPEPKFYKDYLE